MSKLKYHRPKTLDEALDLLADGRPLAGGTRLTPDRRAQTELVDLQDLGLDYIEEEDKHFRLGAMLRLQDLTTADIELPVALINSCRLEAGLNIRNVATVGGSIMAGDGRSPFLTVLLALEASLIFAGQDKPQSLDQLLEKRDAPELLMEIQLANAEHIAFEQVARSPADRPIVCACVARYGDGFNASLGGHGRRPIMVASRAKGAGLAELAAAAFTDAEDKWASAEYRADVASRLVDRLVGKVSSR
jgi:CO/xanthine dehydrogenase FAD-binding subunit